MIQSDAKKEKKNKIKIKSQSKIVDGNAQTKVSQKLLFIFKIFLIVFVRTIFT